MPSESPKKKQVDSLSANDSDSDSEEEVDSALETTLSMIRPSGGNRAYVQSGSEE